MNEMWYNASMFEFRTDGDGEYLIIPEVDRAAAMRLSEEVLADSFDDAEGWIGEAGLATHVRLTYEGDVVLLASQDVYGKRSRCKYILDCKTGGFIVIRGSMADAMSADMPELDPELLHESIETMASMGQYLGTEQDWQDFIQILQDGKTATNNLRAFYEQTGKSAVQGDDWDVSELV